MRVAVWNSSRLPGFFGTGATRHFIEVARRLHDRPGWEMEFLLKKDVGGPWVEDPSQSPLGHLPRRVLPHSRAWLEAVWRLLGWPPITRWCPDAEWVYCPRELWCPPGRARLAVTVHDVYAYEEPHTHRTWAGWAKRRLMMERALGRADVVLAVSEFTKGRLGEVFGVPRGKVAVVGNGVEPEFLAPPTDDERLPEGVREPFVLAVGGLRRKKGARFQLAVARELARRGSAVSLVVVGPTDEAFKAQAAGPNLTILGRGVPAPEVRALTRRAVACVMLSEYEGFGIPLLEGMAAGTPVIAVRRASLPEVVGEAGLLVEPEDAMGVADAIERLDTDAKARERWIVAGRARAAAFTWDAVADRVAQAMEGAA